MTRQQALERATTSAMKAAECATQAENYGKSYDSNHHRQAERYAEACRSWAEASRAFTYLARELPETEPENTDV